MNIISSTRRGKTVSSKDFSAFTVSRFLRNRLKQKNEAKYNQHAEPTHLGSSSLARFGQYFFTRFLKEKREKHTLSLQILSDHLSRQTGKQTKHSDTHTETHTEKKKTEDLSISLKMNQRFKHQSICLSIPSGSQTIQTSAKQRVNDLTREQRNVCMWVKVCVLYSMWFSITFFQPFCLKCCLNYMLCRNVHKSAHTDVSLIILQTCSSNMCVMYSGGISPLLKSYPSNHWDSAGF